MQFTKISIHGDTQFLKISVALCTYNGAQFLKEQLESIRLQSRVPDEIIICDDQSKDNTTNILKDFTSKVPFPVHLYFNEKNLGSTKNFEKAINLCKGDLIFLSDQDDVWHPDKIEQIERIFSRASSIGAVFTDAELVDENLNSLGYNLWTSIGFNHKEQENFTHGKYLEVLLKHNVVTGSTMAFRAEFKKLILPIPEFCVHDGWIALLIAFVSELKIIPKPFIKYRQHQTQQLGAGTEPLSVFEKVYRKIIQLINVQDSFYNFQPEFERYMQVYEHLINSQYPGIKINKIPCLEARISHVYTRINLPTSRKQRIPLALKELLNKNYCRYSEGISSFFGDLLRKGRHVEEKTTI